MDLFCFYNFMTIVNEDFDIIFIIFSALSALNLNEEGISVDLDPVLIKGTHNNVLMWFIFFSLNKGGLFWHDGSRRGSKDV